MRLMAPPDGVARETQLIAQLVGSACGRRALSAAEAEILEWSLIQLALEGSGPIEEIRKSYQATLLAGADWHAAVATALLQTPRQWGASLQAGLSSFEEIRADYRNTDVAVFQFADRIILDRSMEVPPIQGFIPVSAPSDPRPARLVELVTHLDVAGEAMELAKVLSDRFPHILKRHYKLSFEGALAAFLCDLEMEADKIPRLLALSTLISLVFKPIRGIT